MVGEIQIKYIYVLVKEKSPLQPRLATEGTGERSRQQTSLSSKGIVNRWRIT